MILATTGPYALLPEVGILLAVVVGAVLLHALLQRRVRIDTLRRNNEVAGPIFGALGVIYAVLLGFVVVVVWQKYDTTVSNVDSEIEAVTDLYRVVGAFPEPLRSNIRGELRDYVNSMITVEWPSMAERHAIPRNLAILEKIAEQVDRYRYAANAPEQAEVHSMAMDQVERLFDARRARLVESAPSVPAVLWFALTAGGLAILIFSYFFGVDNRAAQLGMTAILTGLIAVLFVVIAEFDAPFRGSVAISGGGWVFLAKHLSQIP